MHKKFDHIAIEKKWQEKWDAEHLYDVGERDRSKEKEYVLVEWPYPSGNLHVGHWFAFAVTDIYVRARRMEGKQVLFPMGFDAFGLPAENAAIKRGLDPKGWTESNIAYMRNQLKSMGNAFSWDKTTSSTDPEYFAWTQWMFTEFLKHDIAYRGKGKVNWCPGCNTVLANEQVLPNGTCERSGDTVEQREMTQWMLRITKFADALIDDLDALNWPEHIKESQRNWIGRSKGARITFPLTVPPTHGVVVLASNNEGKVSRMKKLLKDANLPVELKTPREIGVHEFDVVEDGHTLLENALIKAHALRKLTTLPVLSDDTGFFIDGELINPVTVKRNALQGKDEKSLTVHEIATLMQQYYTDIAVKRGGQIDAEWRHALVLIDDDGEHIGDATRLVTLTSTSKGDVDPYLPLRALYISKATGKYALEQSESEELTELRPITNALTRLLGASVDVFTTRPDTLFGATYLVLAPEHPLVEKLKAHITNVPEVEAYQKATRTKKDEERTAEGKEKTGVRLEGVTATNPASKEPIPVYISDYVISTYGTGALMAVPAHDERDFAFAKKFKLPIKEVVRRHFTLKGTSSVRDGVELVTRDVVDLIIEHPTDGTFLLQSETDGEITHVHFVGGGTEGEPDEVAIQRELEEETGFVNFEIVSKNPVARNSALGFRHTKNKNQYTTGNFYHIKLTDLTQKSSEIDEGKHTIEWVKKDKVAEKITWEGHAFGWEYFLGNTFHAEAGTLLNSGEFNGMDSEKAKEKITAFVGGKMENTYRLRDWSIGRQRYWGVPIPVVYDREGRAHPIPKEHLPWHLPTDVDHTPTGEPPLSKSNELRERVTRIFGEGWTPDYETMDTFVDSSWYFLRYIDNKNSTEFSSTQAQEDWMPIDVYFGGAEHTTMHLLYSRFWQKALHTLGLVRDTEPYVKRINRGLVLGTDGNKMSKSKGNVIDPDEQVKVLGADTVKMYLAFMGPYGEVTNYPWDMGGIAGIRRFLERVYGLSEHIQEDETNETTRLLHKTIKKVGEDVHLYKFNTAISSLMIFLNHVEKAGLTTTSYETFLRLLAPFAPHLTEELWAARGHKESIHSATWPQFVPELVHDESVTIGVQINGKMRGTLTMSPHADEGEAVLLAYKDEALRARLTGTPTKVVYVPGKILNIIVPSEGT